MQPYLKSYQMKILKNLTDGIHPREMMVISAGRRTGKSIYYRYMQELIPYTLKAFAIVDDVKWFTVQCNKEVAVWLRSQPEKMCYEHIDPNWMLHKNMFDMHEKIYTMLQLKYGHDRV
jgi:hypothetical protein